MTDSLRGVVVAHGDLARSLVAAAERITGVTGALTPLSNEGLGAEELRARLREACEPCPVVVFADLAGGSCGMAGLGLRRMTADLAVLTGVNLPMLVDFVFHRDMPLDELVARLEDRGRAGIAGHQCSGEATSGPPTRG